VRVCVSVWDVLTLVSDVCVCETKRCVYVCLCVCVLEHVCGCGVNFASVMQLVVVHGLYFEIFLFGAKFASVMQLVVCVCVCEA